MAAVYRGRSVSRRRFVQSAGVAGLGLLAGCALPSAAPPAQRVYRIGYLGSETRATSVMPAVREGLRDLGYVEGQNPLIDERFSIDDAQLAEPAAELVRLQPEVVVTGSSASAGAVQAISSTIPIVSSGQGDLLATGRVASLARPGGNVTGLSTPVLAGKQLQLLQEAVPTLSRVAVLFDTTLPEESRPRTMYEAAARALGLQLQFVGAGGPEDLGPLFDSALREHADGLFVLSGPVIGAAETRIAELALQSRLPSMWQLTEGVARGGLIGYRGNAPDQHRRVAAYVDKILKGAKPADLPVEQPMVFDFVINLKTAQALGLTIPHHVLLQATEVIQ